MKKALRRTFKHFPDTDKCIICGTNEDRECILIPIFGTEDGSLVQAVPVHTGCLALGYDKENKIIYQVLTTKLK